MGMETTILRILKTKDANALEIAKTIGGDVRDILPVLRRLKTEGLLLEVD